MIRGKGAHGYLRNIIGNEVKWMWHKDEDFRQKAKYREWIAMVNWPNNGGIAG
jgi:hypothetical protein